MIPAAERRSMAQYAEFFDNNRRRALRLAYVMCGNAGDAEDVVAEAFAKMYPAWQRGEVQEPAAYLRRTIANQVRGGWRHRDVERRHEARVQVMWSKESSDFDEMVAARDAVSVAMASLPPKQRAVVALRYLEDLSEAETAAVLELSVGTVKSHASRGLERLREVLSASADESS